MAGALASADVNISQHCWGLCFYNNVAHPQKNRMAQIFGIVLGGCRSGWGSWVKAGEYLSLLSISTLPGV